MKKRQAYIIQWNKNEMGKSYLLDAPTIIVGRSSSADLMLSDTSVSRHHALISQHTNHYDLEDMESSNGTFINARKINGRANLGHGDIIGFGSVLFKFFVGEISELPAHALRSKSMEDELTGLHNKNFTLDYLEAEKTFFETYGRVFSAIYLDFDNFGKLCQVHGQEVGNKVLKEGARRIRELLGDFDVAGRLESDHILVVLPNSTRIAALVLAEHIVDRFTGSSFEILQGEHLLEVKQTVSAGVAQFSEKLTSIESFLELARERMLYCKIKGGNRAAS